MKQTLKISIARGGCRFATPLYLGGSYELSFAGERADEADCVLFTKPRSRNPNKEVGIDALAISVRELPNENPVLNLNKQVLLDWFRDCGCCEVDATVDAHCYVFNASGEAIADSDVCIEYMPVDFVIDTDGFAKWDELRIRIVALEEHAREAQAKFEAQTAKNASLDETDAQNLIAAANDATRKANETLDAAKSYADAIMNMVAKIQYVKCEAESTTEKQVYHRVVITKNAHGAHTLAIDETPVSIEGGDPETTRYVYTDTNQQISGNKTFTGDTKVKTADADSNDTNAANTAWVNAKLLAEFTSFLNKLLSTDNTWTAKQTFGGRIEGNLTGDVTGNLTGDVTGDVEGNVDATTLDVAGAETHGGAETHEGTEAHAGAETHDGAEVHNGLVKLNNVDAPSVGYSSEKLADKKGINQKFFWDAVTFLAKYTDGSYRIGIEDEPVYDAAEWRTHDRQIGYVNWVANAVGSRCFFGKTTLTKADFPNVTEVKSSAFEGCTILTDIKFPQCKKIAPRGFWNCDKILALSVDNFPLLERIENNAFNDASSLNSIELPRCKLVDEDAFSAIGAVTNIELGSEVTDDELGDPAVIDAVLDQLPLNENVDNAYTALLTLVPNLKDTYTVFDGYIYDKDALTKFHAPKMQVLGDISVSSCNMLFDVNIEKVLFIGGRAMSQIKYNNGAPPASIPYLKIPECRYIGYQAFGSMTNSYFNYPVGAVRADSLKYVCCEAFYMARGLTQFYAPHLKRIANSAFWGCIELVGSSYTENGVTIGNANMVTFDECTHVGATAFSGRGVTMAMTKISLNACEHIGNGAFNNCSNLTDVYLYSMNGNQLVQAPSSTDLVDASIGNWGLPTTDYSGTTESHTGVAVHCVNDAGQHIIVGYQGGWKVIGLE